MGASYASDGFEIIIVNKTMKILGDDYTRGGLIYILYHGECRMIKKLDIFFCRSYLGQR